VGSVIITKPEATDQELELEEGAEEDLEAPCTTTGNTRT
jgi:hypothetical protein